MQCTTDKIKYIGSLLHSFFFHALKLASLFSLSRTTVKSVWIDSCCMLLYYIKVILMILVICSSAGAAGSVYQSQLSSQGA